MSRERNMNHRKPSKPKPAVCAGCGKKPIERHGNIWDRWFLTDASVYIEISIWGTKQYCWRCMAKVIRDYLKENCE